MSTPKHAAWFAITMILVSCGTAGGDIPGTEPSTKVLSPSPTISIPDQLPPVQPVVAALKATFNQEVAQDIPTYVRSIAGVASAARVALSNVTVSIDGNPALLSVAAVDPLEYRPFAPDVTAQAEFVWKGLMRGDIFLAHEEHRRLGTQPGGVLFSQPAGAKVAMRVGGVAANGTPNLAGGLVSVDRGRELGMGEPNLLLVALSPGAKEKDVIKSLGKMLIGVRFEKVSSQGRAFISGGAAANAIGSFAFTPNADGTITQDPEWVRRNITSIKVPIFGSVTCHRVMKFQLQGALGEIESSGLANLIDRKQYGGCYVPRFIGRDQNLPLSMHAWGLAIDLNVSTNLQGNQPTLDPRIVEIFERWGFRWGGRWSNPDGMHFELAALMKQPR